VAKRFKVKLSYDYHQISVFNSDLKDPFNAWTDAHVHQGFAWRPGSVSFATMSDSGTALIKGSIGESFSMPGQALRVIVVPFVVTSGAVEVGGFETVTVPIPPGTYELTFVAVSGDVEKPEEYHFYFVPCVQPRSAILLADPDLTPPEVLCMDAKPAV
jgi:hypothetical protein